jgi:hypothetical protein
MRKLASVSVVEFLILGGAQAGDEALLDEPRHFGNNTMKPFGRLGLGGIVAAPILGR